MIPVAGESSEPVALQPLAWIDADGERAWAAEWIATLLARESVTITPDLKEHLWSALTSLVSAPVTERTLTGLSVLLQSSALKQALQPYTVGGPWGRLLDAEAEHRVFERFRALTRGRTAVLVSHRFPTVRMADRVIVLEQGRVVEQGTHDELVAAQGRYARLFELQARGYR